ncbi:MAG: hypothetical protein LBT86_05345 [Deltaproteobacteria bacterium]|nr:hypothetical protein [Deltaproteobacteria bacterium]
MAWEERMISNYRSEIYDPNFSDFIDEVENKINTCILFNVETRLPVCQSVYTGSLKNPETLNQVFADFENLTTKADKITLFLGTEFYKDKILRLYKKFDFKYIINMPFSIAITEQLVNDAKKFIFETEYVIFSPNDSLKGITLDSELLKIDPKAQARIFLDLAYHLEDRAQFDLQLQELVTLYLSGDKKITHDKLFKKYIHINPNLPIDDKRHVLIDHLAFEDALAVSGWIVFISNSSIDNQNLHYGWLAKESIKNYTFYSNSVFNLEKYKPYVDDAVENKLLVSFIVSILSYHIQKVFEDNKLHKEYSLNDLVNNISIIDCYIDKKGQTVTQKLSPEQQQYYDLFKIPAPQACYPPGFDLDE